MSVVKVDYRGGARVRGVRGADRVWRRGSFGDLSVPVGELRPVDPKLIKNLRMPVDNPGLWEARQRRLLDTLMYALAYDIKHILNHVLTNAKSGGKYGITIAAASSFTKAMRARNRTDTPLKEWGFLQQAMDVELKYETRQYVVAVTFDKKKEKSGSRRTARDANKVALYIEKGFTITVTQRMKEYFEWQAKRLEQSATSMSQKGQRNFAKFMSNRQSAFSWLSTLRVGSTTRVKPRPFVRPSMQAGVESWEKKYFASGTAARLIAKQWMRGNVTRTAFLTGV